MPVIVFHPEPTYSEYEIYQPNNTGALEYILAFPLIVALVLALFLRK